MTSLTATHTFITKKGRRVVDVVIERLDRTQWVELHGQPGKRFADGSGMIEYRLDGVPAGRAFLSAFSLAVALENKGLDLARGVVIGR